MSPGQGGDRINPQFAAWVKQPWLAPFVGGLGLGFFIAGLVWVLYPAPALSPRQIEEQARQLGMGYREEFVPWAPPEGVAAPGTPAEPAPAASPPAPEMQTIYIAAGSTLDEVADQLVRQGIITDREDFIRTAHELQASRRLVAGNYTLPVPVSNEELVKILTGWR